MRATRKTVRRGFTLAEVLAALIFMAIVLPAAVQGVLTAGRAGIVAVRSREASALGDAMLTQLITTGEWEDNLTRGDFGEDWPDYRWELLIDTWQSDYFVTMTELTLEVVFTSQGQEYRVPFTTLVTETTTEDTSDEATDDSTEAAG